MFLNHKAAIELLVQAADEIGFDRYTILNLRGMLAANLLPDPDAAGRLRRIPVTIGGSAYDPLEVPQLLEAGFQMFLAWASAIEDAFEQAFFAMAHGMGAGSPPSSRIEPQLTGQLVGQLN